MNPRLVKLKRILILDLPLQQSAFLWGGRKTGKSTFLQDHYPGSVYYDLLKNDLFIELSTRPEKLREEVLHLTKKQLKQPIIIDEVQRVPALLNEIHWLIENTEASFILEAEPGGFISSRLFTQRSLNLIS